VQVAREKFSVALTALSSLKGIPEDAKKQLQEARNKVLSQVDGKWGLGSCDQPALFTIKDAMLQQYWPSMGLAEEKIVQVGGSAVLTSVQTPASQRGKLFKIHPGRRQARCGRRGQRPSRIVEALWVINEEGTSSHSGIVALLSGVSELGRPAWRGALTA
jgi:hypothetical protein